MKRVRVNTGYVALVYRKGELTKVLDKGDYRVSWRDQVEILDMSRMFAPTNLRILIKNQSLVNALHVVDVEDGQVAIVYASGKLESVLSAGLYGFWKGLINYQVIMVDTTSTDQIAQLKADMLKRPELVGLVQVVNVEPYEKAILYVDGVQEETLNPGRYYYWRNATTLTTSKVDMRQQRLEVTGQEILTADKVAVRLNYELSYRVEDVQKAVIDTKDYVKQLYVNVQLAIREYLGAMTLDGMLESKTEISEYVTKQTMKSAKELGVVVIAGGVKDIILPGEIKEIMNQVLVAQKTAQANVIARREETASARSLLNTAKLMEENPALWKLKEMEYVEKIADKINTVSVSGGGQVLEQLKEMFVK